MSFRAWQLTSELRDGRYAPGPKVVFAAPKKITRADDRDVYHYRPLAIQKFRDEVVETALVMLCADYFESEWGDTEQDVFPKLCSYGNRIFRSDIDGGKFLALGSSHLYREWPEDYASFVKNTASSFNGALKRLNLNERCVMFSSDIKEFFPNINRAILRSKIRDVVPMDAEVSALVDAVFGRYAVFGCEYSQSPAIALEEKGLLQGPVHSGFWSNVYLSGFDDWIKSDLIRSLSARGIEARLESYARYVDDFHLVLVVRADVEDIESGVRSGLLALLNDRLSSLELSLADAKTNLISQDKTGSLLTTGQVADRMAAITKKAYFPMAPDELADLEAEVRYIFGAPRETTSHNEMGATTILDNPGVRDGSRKRFAATKWLRIARDLEGLHPGWIGDHPEFPSELIREWMQDPSQVQLLQRALDAGVRPTDMSMFLKRLNSLRDVARPFYNFVWAYLLDLLVYQGKDYGLPYTQISEQAIENADHPVLVQRSIAWKLKRKRAVSSSEARLPQELRDKYWAVRQHLWAHAARPSFLTPFEIGALLVSVKPTSRVLISLGEKALQVTSKREESAQLLRSILIRRPNEAVKIAEGVASSGFAKAVPELNAFSSQSKQKGLLYEHVLRGAYRNPEAWLGLAASLGRLFDADDVQQQAARGLIHPFSIEVRDGLTLSICGSPSILTAYSSGGFSRIEDGASGGWAYSIALMLRAAATADPVDLVGATPIARFSMAGTISWLARKNARLGSSAAVMLDRLSWWAGSRIRPFADVGEFQMAVQEARANLAISSCGKIVLGDITVDGWQQGQDGPHCVALCQLRSAPLGVSDASVRRALSIIRTLLLEREESERALSLVVFPELSVPRSSIGALCRFARMTGCVVLAGLSLIKSKDRKSRINELAWIVPLETKSGRVMVLRQEKIFITKKEQELIPPVKSAEPPVVWRIMSDRARFAAINCYEFTHLPLRDLIRGRVELLVVSANNQDVTTFDNLVESTHYDIYGHVVLVNSQQHGGSAMRAPYREPWDRRIFDVHGANMFSVNVCYAQLDDFRAPVPKKKVKSRPAGFELKKP